MDYLRNFGLDPTVGCDPESLEFGSPDIDGVGSRTVDTTLIPKLGRQALFIGAGSPD